MHYNKMPIPNVSSRNYLTLNHLFAVPSSHQRDFVRENKQFVRNKSKEQHKAKQNDVPITSYVQTTGSQGNIGYGSGRSSSRQAGSSEQSIKNFQHKNREFRPSFETKERNLVKSKSVSTQRQQPSIQTKSKASVPQTQNVAVQTDEICDEVYLYTALKKCASPAFKSALKAKYLQKEEESKNKHEHKLENDERQYPPNEGPNLRPSIYPQFSVCSEPDSSKIYTKHQKSPEKKGTIPVVESPKFKSRVRTYHFEEDENVKPARASINGKSNFFDIDNNCDRHIILDNFNVMALPPEMKKSCQPNVCANCPEGYHLLNEKERDQIKAKLLDREALLIKQLNSFPLAIETLRVRQSKTRIERELSIIEQNLRKLTKRKVYAKITDE